MSEERTHFSRCSVGKNKWFWVTYRTFEQTCNRAADASGYATSAGDAENRARAAIHSKYGEVQVEQYPSYYAQGVHRHDAIKRRASKKSSQTDAKEVEYLYADYDGGYDSGSFKHGIIKKTAKRVYVARYPIGSCNEDDEWEEGGQVFHDVQTVVLNRQQLETKGWATNRNCWTIFHTTPWEERNKPATPQYLEVLGLDRGANPAAIDGAYRHLAMKYHPDRGGDVAEFKRLQEAYEAAMSSML